MKNNQNNPNPVGPAGNIAWLSTTVSPVVVDTQDTTQPGGQQDIGISGLSYTDPVTVHVEVVSGYKAIVSIQGVGQIATFTAGSHTYDLYMPNADVLV